jgi:hypothetical protein
VFLELGEDPRALCFAAVITNLYFIDMDRLRRSANLGCAFAQANMANLMVHEGRKKLCRR